MGYHPPGVGIGELGLDGLTDVDLVHEVIPGGVRRELVDEAVGLFFQVASRVHGASTGKELLKTWPVDHEGATREPPNVLARGCKARLVILARSYPLGHALAAPWRG